MEVKNRYKCLKNVSQVDKDEIVYIKHKFQYRSINKFSFHGSTNGRTVKISESESKHFTKLEN